MKSEMWGPWVVRVATIGFLLVAALRSGASPTPGALGVLGASALLAAIGTAWIARRHPAPSRISWLAVVLAIVVGLAVGGMGRSRTDARRHLAAAESAFRSGNCKEANRGFDRVLRFSSLSLWGIDRGKADEERTQCAEVLAADDERRSGNFGAAASSYGTFLTSHPGSSLIPQVRRAAADLYLEWGDNMMLAGRFDDAVSKFQTLLSGFGEAGAQGERARMGLGESYLRWGVQLRESHQDVAAIEKFVVVRRRQADTPAGPRATQSLREMTAAALALAGSKACEALTTLEPLAAVDDGSTDGAAASVPHVLLACGQQHQREGRYEEAVGIFRSVISRFPGSAEAAAAEPALINAEVALAKGSATSPLPAPTATGAAPRGTTMVIVRNSSPERLEVLASGPTPKRVTIEPCGECKEDFIAPLDCPTQGPEVAIALGPGTYDIVARSPSDPAITPFSGSWSLLSGTSYTHCFFIVRGLGDRVPAVPLQPMQPPVPLQPRLLPTLPTPRR